MDILCIKTLLRELKRHLGIVIQKYIPLSAINGISKLTTLNRDQLMAESRAQYVQERGLPKGYSHFMNIDRFGEIGVLTSPISNWLLSNKIFRSIAEYITGIDKRRNFPRFSTKTFNDTMINPSNISAKKTIAFFYDTYINYNNPILGLKIIEIFNPKL